VLGREPVVWDGDWETKAFTEGNACGSGDAGGTVREGDENGSDGNGHPKRNTAIPEALAVVWP
jgi:hypothetical protein